MEERWYVPKDAPRTVSVRPEDRDQWVLVAPCKVPDDDFNPLGGASRGVGRCSCAAGPGTNPGCPVHP